MMLRDPRPVKALRLCTALAVAAGVVLTAAGRPTVTGLLPYFTIQSNLAYGTFALLAALLVARGGWWTAAPVKGAVTLYVVITGLVYHLVLTNSASGFAMAAVQRDLAGTIGNQLLHTVVPLLAVLDWLAFDSRGRYRWRYALYWLAFPVWYLAFAMVRGLVVHTYPYPFIDVGRLGYRGVAVSAVVFAVAFWVLGILFVLIDRGFADTGPAGAIRRARAARSTDGRALTPGPTVAAEAASSGTVVPAQPTAASDGRSPLTRSRGSADPHQGR